MKRKRLWIWVAALVAVCLLSGCFGRQTEEESPAEEAVEETPDIHAGQVEVADGYGGTVWVDEAENLSVFPLDTSAFVRSGDDVTYTGEDYTLVRGIDVSDHQTEIDWQAVADSGIEFAIIRCGWRGYSGGSLNEDTTFRQNIEGAKAAGLKVGVYFFSQATSMVEGAEEAIFTLNLLEGYSLDLPVFFDWEEIGVESARTDNVSGETVTAAALEFCRLVESAGYDSGIYAYLNLAYFTYDLNQLEGITIWMGNPGSAPEFYYDHTYWQYSFTGSVDGIEGDVDLDVIFRRTTPLVVDVSESAAQEEQG
jgi:GH25 family lysozyme M1 (1,4-beta-N-acetylmuramidase)